MHLANGFYLHRRYIRLKRHNTTVFMHCEPADNFATIKAKAGKLMNIEQGQIGLFATRDKVTVMWQSWYGTVKMRHVKGMVR